MQVTMPTSRKVNVTGNISVDQYGGVNIVDLSNGQNLRVAPENVTESLRPKIRPGLVLNGANLRMSDQKNLLYSISPASGKHVVTFTGMITQGGATIPEPRFQQGGKTFPGKFGGSFTTKDKYTFSAIVTIEAGPFEGFDVPLFFDYLFVPDQNGRIAIGDPMGSSSKKKASFLTDFLEIHLGSLVNFDHPYEPNFLPTLETMLQQSTKPFQIVIEKGYVNEVEELPAGITVEMIKAASPRPQEQQFTPAQAPVVVGHNHIPAQTPVAPPVQLPPWQQAPTPTQAPAYPTETVQQPPVQPTQTEPPAPWEDASALAASFWKNESPT